MPFRICLPRPRAMAPRRARFLAGLVLVFLLACFYLARSPKVKAPPLPVKSAEEYFRRPQWRKRPDKYPVAVASLHTLPTTDAPTAQHMPNIQRHPAPPEDEAARRVRRERLARVRETFVHCWEGYKRQAWLSDELAPLSGARRDAFGGWAVTLVDALDTLWIMGLTDEFDMAVRAATQNIDFSRSNADHVDMFETTIRYLGGFLAAYELSGHKHPLLLHRAVEVGELIMGAFDTPNRMPIALWGWHRYIRNWKQVAPKQVFLSQLGSMGLELTKLSQLTGDMRYYDAAQRVADVLEEHQAKTKLPGMWPATVNAAKQVFSEDNLFTLGAMADTTYECLPKQYIMLGGASDQPKKMYEAFMETAKRHIFRRVVNEGNIPLVIAGDSRVVAGSATPKFEPNGQHLACFAGGMVALAARVFNRQDDLELATQLTDGCVWTYGLMPSGVGPESFTFMPCGTIDVQQQSRACRYTPEGWHSAVWEYWADPSRKDALAKQDQQLAQGEIDKVYEAGKGSPAGEGGEGGEGGRVDGSSVPSDKPAMEALGPPGNGPIRRRSPWFASGTDKRPKADSHSRNKDKAAYDAGEADRMVARQRLRPGLVDVAERTYRLRAEAIESVFTLYRVTGDRGWMDKAWAMFERVDKLTRTELGAAALADVTLPLPPKLDSMESFWLAQTLKYYYLVFADWDTVDLDVWVLNTEAHPLRRPDAKADRSGSNEGGR